MGVNNTTVHELAHCMQMNHSASFWKVRNQYAEELRGLWAKNYTGDGFWGRGKTVLSEKYENSGPPMPEVMPRSLCGGTFRSRGRKRKRKADGPSAKSLTYAERQQKRIAKKFGTNGVALGSDEETRVKLEHGAKVKAKPKVAGSVRGREPRAAAAFARLGQQKKEEETAKADPDPESGSETEDDCQSVDEEEIAVDINGSSIRDSKGNSMIKLCSDEDRNDANVKEEMQELQDLEALDAQPQLPVHESSSRPSPSGENSKPDMNQAVNKPTQAQKQVPSQESWTPSSTDSHKLNELLSPENTTPNTSTCAICSMENEQAAITCAVCAHLLDPKKVHGYWRCQSSTCRGSQYLNVDDCVLCGACGARRHSD